MTPAADAVSPLSDLPATATAREAAARMTYADACRVAGSILDGVKAGTITQPYSAGQRLALEAVAIVFTREAREGPGMIFGWCRHGHHADCRAIQEAGDGSLDRCGCWCHARAEGPR
jgi:hypothetical protein